MEILLSKQYHSISFIELHLRWKVQLYKLISNVVSAPTDSHPSSLYFITIKYWSDQQSQIKIMADISGFISTIFQGLFPNAEIYTFSSICFLLIRNIFFCCLQDKWMVSIGEPYWGKKYDQNMLVTLSYNIWYISLYELYELYNLVWAVLSNYVYFADSFSVYKYMCVCCYNIISTMADLKFQINFKLTWHPINQVVGTFSSNLIYCYRKIVM